MCLGGQARIIFRRDVIGLWLQLCRHLECSAGWLSRLRRKAIFRRLWPIAVTVQHSRAFNLALCLNDLGLALDRNLRLDRGTDRRCDDSLLWRHVSDPQRRPLRVWLAVLLHGRPDMGRLRRSPAV